MDRKLTAILYADVAGYSRLTGADEKGTHAALKAHLGTLTKAIHSHGGRIVNTAGDAVLAEFGSVVTALECAVAAQRDMAERDKDVPEPRKLQFRVGVNLGDIIVDGDEIYGNGVNVAARLEALADAGGICVSGRVHEQVEGKLDVGFAFMGPQSVKNIKQPVNAYKVLLDPADAGKTVTLEKPKPPAWRWPATAAVLALIVAAGIGAMWLRPSPLQIEPASMERMAFPLPDKPSIAVLPFDNLSGEKEQDAIADGLSEDIITALSRIPDLFVIARNSTFTYKGKPVKVQQVAEELGVRYVLEGSVQRSGDHLRVTAQLIDALDGRHLWADRYDRKIEDLFALQDEIARKVLIELQVKLTFGEHARVSSRGTKSLEAWLLRNQGYAEGLKLTKEGMLKARDLYQAAVDADPEYARAWAGLAWSDWFEARLGGWGRSREEALTEGIAYAERVIEIDPQEPIGFIQLANLLGVKGEHDRAVETARHAVVLGPSDYQARAVLGMLLTWAGDPSEAVAAFKQSMRLSPRYPAWIDWMLGHALHMAGEPEEAIASIKKGIARAPTSPWPRPRLIAVYADLNRMEEAKAEADEQLKLQPDFTVSSYIKANPFKREARKIWLRDLLLKAGLPENPPLPLPDKPSIAVLPFDNLTGDAEQEYLVDGFTETVTETLSRLPELFVIARNSAFTYKGKPTRVQDVGRDLGVRYVLEGSIQRAEQRLRVTVQLIDTKTGNHLWSERYDREQSDIFALQDEIAFKTAVALEVKLTEGGQAWTAVRTTDSLEAWLLYVRSLAEYRKLSKASRAEARKLAEQALAIDPNFGGALLMIGWTQLDDARFAGVDDRERALESAEATADKIAALYPDLPSLHNFLGSIYLTRKEYDRAMAAKRKAIELDPNNPNYLASTARALYYMGDYGEAISMMKQAMRLDPRAPSWYFFVSGASYVFVGDYGQAIAAAKDGLERAEGAFMKGVLHIIKAFAYVESGDVDEGRREVEIARNTAPYMTVEFLRNRSEHRNPAALDRYLGALSKAGLPETKEK